MPLVKNSGRFVKKPALSGAAARSAALKKSNAPKKPKPGSKSSGEKPRKPSRSAAKFSSVKSRQAALEKVKCSIWAALQTITEELIKNANTGNLSTAKELFNLAGVYSLPTPDDEEAAAVALAGPVAVAEPTAADAVTVHPIDLFFKKIGVEPSTGEPEPEVA